jgi:hypothetical protein
MEDEFLLALADGTRLKAVTRADEDLHEGATVGLSADPADMSLFDDETGEALAHGLSNPRPLMMAG